MGIEIPEKLKAEVPLTIWGKILMATPVVMTVIATMLAGLASSEMTRAQYDRALAAQQQSKAGDQWSFFQAKRLRGALQRNTSDLLQATTDVHPLESARLRAVVDQLPPELAQAATVKAELVALLDSAAGRQALDYLSRGEVPHTAAAQEPDQKLKAVLEAIETSKPEAEIAALLSGLDDQTLDAAIRSARDRTQAFDDATRPVNQTIDLLDSLLAKLKVYLWQEPASRAGGDVAPAGASSLIRDFANARLRYAALRYETEARLNQAVANFYEVQVRKGNLSAERHHARSQRFFFGMLAAQAAVIIATFAIAARQRNLLWSLAALAGLAAVALAVYVYFFV